MGELLTAVTVTQDHPGESSTVLYEQSFQCPDMGDTEPEIVLAQMLSSVLDDLQEKAPGRGSPGAFP